MECPPISLPSPTTLLGIESFTLKLYLSGELRCFKRRKEPLCICRSSISLSYLDVTQRLCSVPVFAFCSYFSYKQQLRQCLYRSGFHKTTTINGKYQDDPNSWHLTFCYKDEEQLANETLTACHGYTSGKDIYELVKPTHAGEKADATIKPRNNERVWPDEADLQVAPDVGYSHLADQRET